MAGEPDTRAAAHEAAEEAGEAEAAEARQSGGGEAGLLAAEEAVEGARTDRLCAFSDGVFSIVITLLILDIKVPRPDNAGASLTAVFGALAGQWPMFVAYLLGFLTVGILWANHVVLFCYIRRTDHRLVTWNTILLLLVSLTPFTTSLLSQYLDLGGNHLKAATLVYGGVFTVMALAFNLLWRHAFRGNRGLLNPELDPRLFAEVNRRFRFGPLLYLLSFLAAFVSPLLSIGLMGALALFFALPYERSSVARGAYPFARPRRANASAAARPEET